MKHETQKPARKLQLSRETVRNLNEQELREAAGGRIKLTQIRASCECEPSLPISVCGCVTLYC